MFDLLAQGDNAVEIGSWIEFDCSGNNWRMEIICLIFEKTRREEILCWFRDMTTTTALLSRVC